MEDSPVSNSKAFTVVTISNAKDFEIPVEMYIVKSIFRDTPCIRGIKNKKIKDIILADENFHIKSASKILLSAKLAPLIIKIEKPILIDNEILLRPSLRICSSWFHKITDSQTYITKYIK